MSTETTSEAVPPATPATPARTRPFYWSVRRELWEHRSIVVAPLIVASLALLGFVISLSRLAHTVSIAGPVPTKPGFALVMPYIFVGSAILLPGRLTLPL